MEEKLRRLMKHEGINSTRLAEILGIQASGISHIMSGRNKPSYDFLLKLLQRFPQINPDWLMLDRGPMYRDEIKKSPGTSAGGATSANSASSALTGGFGERQQVAVRDGGINPVSSELTGGLGGANGGAATGVHEVRHPSETCPSSVEGRSGVVSARLGDAMTEATNEAMRGATIGVGAGDAGVGEGGANSGQALSINRGNTVSGTLDADLGFGNAGRGRDLFASREHSEEHSDSRAARQTGSSARPNTHSDSAEERSGAVSARPVDVGGAASGNVKTIERVVVLYRDKTFSEYRPE